MGVPPKLARKENRADEDARNIIDTVWREGILKLERVQADLWDITETYGVDEVLFPELVREVLELSPHLEGQAELEVVGLAAV
ncbi:hypothetical protein [Thermococcus sp. GR6]|uniref:hypothetical protein n=1 Tax=Thermococcus sp. GR6 TaxID=1638256 RepID=UPI00142FF45B|nr:hypothetical protein [Thermococcus sp. GR6]NJE42913.1 hypothetical protein [Thermococcus sp. GR6]